MSHHEERAAGFSRLSLPMMITVTWGALSTEAEAARLATELGVPDLSERLAAFLRRTRQESEPRASPRESSFVQENANANAGEEFLNAMALAANGASSVAAPAAPSNADREGFAHYLAETLGDRGLRNIAFYRLVVRTVPREIVMDALMRAKDAQDIRKSRAHLFAFLVRNHLPERRAFKS